MKYLKRFNEGKSKNKSEKFIKLKSINSWLDPHYGKLYDDFFDSPDIRYSDDDPMSTFRHVDQNYTSYAGISKEDKKIIEEYFKTGEDIFKPNINFDLIDTIKDLSLEKWIDKGWKLNINVEIKNNKVYSEWLGLNDEEVYWFRFFPETLDYLKELNQESNYYYLIRLLKPSVMGSYISDRSESYELASDINSSEIIKKYYPDLKYRVIASYW
jgi:hypothetical protein